MVHKIGGDYEILNSPSQLKFSNFIILPGVGAFDNAMLSLKKDGWIDSLKKYVLIDEKPILGLCLGMHLMTRGSQEGKEQGLNFIAADTIKFNLDKLSEKKRIPNMGWNTISIKKNSFLFNNSNQLTRFYFAHSYHVICDNPSDILTTTFYGYDFISSFQKKNIIGVQFHPEKSHKFGFNFFQNIIRNQI